MQRGVLPGTLPVGGSLRDAMNREGLTIRQSMRRWWACWCCEPNMEFTYHDYAATYEEGQQLPTLFYVTEDAPYCGRCMQHSSPGCKETVYTAFTARPPTEPPTSGGSQPNPDWEPQNVLLTHSKTTTCPTNCCVFAGDGSELRCPCCCWLPYLETRDATNRLLGSSQYLCDQCLCVPKYNVLDANANVHYLVRSDVCCCGCCVKCVWGKGGRKCCAVPFRIRDPVRRPPYSP